MKIIFMGSSDFAVKSLEAILADDFFTVTAVVTQPDKPKGRGYVLTPTPVKVVAVEHGIEVFTPNSLKNGELQPILDEHKPDCIVVAAYGKILPPYVLDYPKFGCINVHASLLPAYRGAAPINFAIMNGEKVTGITTMYMDVGLDTGDMIYKAETPISDNDNAETLHDRLAEMGGTLIIKTLHDLYDGKAPRIPQEGESSYASMINDSVRRIDFNDTTEKILNKIRGLSPIPSAYALINGKNTKIFKAEKINAPENGKIVIKTADGYVRITELQPEGKKRMRDEDFLRGNKVNTVE